MKYIELGQADGVPLIFLHGMTDNSRSWSLVASYFTNKYHVFMLDQRGHGDSDKPDLRMYPLALYATPPIWPLSWRLRSLIKSMSSAILLGA